MGEDIILGKGIAYSPKEMSAPPPPTNPDAEDRSSFGNLPPMPPARPNVQERLRRASLGARIALWGTRATEQGSLEERALQNLHNRELRKYRVQPVRDESGGQISYTFRANVMATGKVSSDPQGER